MTDVAQTVLVNIKGDSSSIEQAAEKSRKSIKGVGDEADKSGEKGKGLGHAFSVGSAAIGAAMTAGVVSVAHFAASSIKDYQSVEDSVTKFQAIAANAGWSQQVTDRASHAFGVISTSAARAGADTAAAMGVSGPVFATLQDSLGDIAVKWGGAAHAGDQYSSVTQKVARAISSGSTLTLTRLGIVLDANQQKLFKNGDQMQRAQLVAQVTQNTVHGLNEQISNTPSGEIVKLSNSFKDVHASLGGMLSGASSPENFINNLTAMVNQAIVVFQMMAPRIIQAIAASIPQLIAAMVKLVPVILTSVAQAIIKNGKPIIDAFGNIFKTGSTQAKWLTGIALTIGGIVVAYKAWTTALGVWKAITTVATTTQALFNGTILASPITWIVLGIAAVVAALVVFFTKTKVGQKIWHDFTSGIVSAWKWVTGELKSGWDWVVNIFKTAWGWIDQHVVQPFKSGIHDIGETFDKTADWIRTSWDKVKDAAAKPVHWVVDTVYTNGIEKVWNGIAKAVGLDLKLPDAPKFATGGIMPGYTPGSDVGYAMVSGGEAIMRPEWTRAVGADNIMRWNALAATGGVSAVSNDMGHYASGGIVGWAKNAASSVGKFFGDVAANVKDFVKDPGSYITSRIVNPVKDLIKGAAGGDWGQIVGQLPVKVAQSLVDKVKSFASGVGNAVQNFVAGAGVAQWTPQVLQALAMLGQPATWLNTVLRRMNQESGGNPNAINNWDSNARMGQPSQGLMQTIPSTFAAYAGPFAGAGILNPLANIYAGLNYALHRYGSLSALDRPGGYAKGGRVSGVGYEGLARISDNEYVINAQAARGIGYRQLDGLNRTGKLGTTINVTTAAGTDTLALAQELGMMLRRA